MASEVGQGLGLGDLCSPRERRLAWCHVSTTATLGGGTERATEEQDPWRERRV